MGQESPQYPDENKTTNSWKIIIALAVISAGVATVLLLIGWFVGLHVLG